MSLHLHAGIRSTGTTNLETKVETALQCTVYEVHNGLPDSFASMNSYFGYVNMHVDKSYVTIKNHRGILKKEMRVINQAVLLPKLGNVLAKIFRKQ